MSRRTELLTAALSLGLTILLCLGLYQWDNKYSRPIGGLLSLSAGEPKTTPLRYLVREWEYWPGRLLPPEAASRERGCRSTGETSDLEAGRGHGCGTYRLTLLLPEIFSAYRLFISGRQVLQLGVPETEGYRPALGARMVTFSASGPTEVLLAVSDYSGVYSGLTYSPAFGTARAVLAAREARLLIHGAPALLFLLCGTLAVCFGLRNRGLQGLPILLACLCCTAPCPSPSRWNGPGGTSHDLRHHMRALRIMAGQGQMEQLLSYLENCESHMREHEVTTFSGHVAADAALCYYADAVRLLGGIFDARLPLPPDLAFPDDELCILRTVRSCPQSEAVDSLCLFLRNGPPPRALFSFFPKTLISG